MAEVSSLAITVHDYMGMPEGPPYYQLIEGDLIMSPSPHWRHQRVSRNIEKILERYLDQHPTGELFHAPLDVILTEINVYQPDVLFFPNERKSLLGKRCIEGAPDFVVEILSDSTAHLDKGPKRKIYARSGVKELWFVDPVDKTVEVFNLETSTDEAAASYRGAEDFTSETFPGLKISCPEIFRGA